MSEKNNEITEMDLIGYGFKIKESHTESVSWSESLQSMKIWINTELCIELIPNGKGYLPKYCPPLVVTPQDEQQLPFSKDGKFILTLEDLKALIKYVKNKRLYN